MFNLDRLDENWYQKVYHCYSDIIMKTFEFYGNKPDFYASALPITTNSISSPMGLGSDSLPVEIDLFSEKTFLADSMQFLLEYGLRFKGKGAFYIMPTFRGEALDERHLNQFYHSECEIFGSLTDVMVLCEEYIKFIVSFIISQPYYDVEEKTKKDIENIIRLKEFPKIKFEDAKILMLKNNINGIDVIDGIEVVNSTGERWLIEYYGGVVWLMNPLHLSVPFYQAYDSINKNYAKCADLLLGMGETLGCGERANYVEVIRSLEEHSVYLSDYEWYIEMKKRYPLKTSGFGLGIERLIAWLFNIDDIRKIPYVSRENGKIIFP